MHMTDGAKTFCMKNIRARSPHIKICLEKNSAFSCQMTVKR